MKTIAAALLFPIPLCLIPSAVGLVLLWFTKNQKAGKILVSVGLFLLFLFSVVDVGGMLLVPLEGVHPPLTGTRLDQVLSALPGEPAICVLGTGFTGKTVRPFNSQTDTGFLARLTEGARVRQPFPNSDMLISVGGQAPQNAKKEFLDEWANLMGIPQEHIILVSGAGSTESEAAKMADMLQGRPAIVVTAASHLPRAMAAFRRHGVEATPAPCYFMTAVPGAGRGVVRLPGTGSLVRLELAIYECLAIGRDSVRAKLRK